MTVFMEGLLANIDEEIDLATLFEVEEKNNYVDRSILEFELPRVMAQARIVFKHLSYYFSLVSPIFPTKGNFLDIGSGPGVLTSLMLEKYFPGMKGKALELSDYMFKFGSVFCSEAEWSQGTVYNLPYASDSMDFIFSSFLFMHLSEPKIALAEISRILKKGGLFFIIDPDYYNTQGSSPFFTEVLTKFADYIKSQKEGDYGIMKVLPELAYKANLELLEREYAIITNDHVNQSSYSVDFPFFSLGKMLCWNFICSLSNRAKENDKIYTMYQDLQNDYMGNKISIRTKLPLHIYIKN